MTLRLIGDIHGKFGPYKKIINACEESIQVGDLGIGFTDRWGRPCENPPHYAMVRSNHRFIRGNHDNPASCKNHSQWIPDGAFLYDDRMMLVGGAYSIDKAYRTEGLDWWPDEELDYPTLSNIIMSYEIRRPEIMVTHEAPDSVARQLFNVTEGYPSRTRQAFAVMFEIHPPLVWVFGHWHEHRDVVINGTRFICLAECQYVDIDI
jgi:hypothetical protein